MPPGEKLAIATVVEAFPKRSETFVWEEVHQLVDLGHRVRVEARFRPSDTLASPVGVPVAYAFETPLAARLASLAGLAVREPVAVARDARARRRWAAEEPVVPLRVLAPVAARLRAEGIEHLHAHFAGPSALDALRLGRLLGLTTSVIVHGFDVFQQPRNLRDKLRGADLALAPCEYTARHARAAADVPVEVVVMGVDGSRFVRSTPYPGGRSVLAIGRLVEKKGFAHLIDAAAVLERRGAPLDHVTIIGDGPLHEALDAQRRTLGLEHRVTLAGPGSPDEVRSALERSDVLAAPCVVAADGDRDAMPVVVKEALAMEVPVVASDEVGLPEIVREGWGRLAPPGDAGALADALDALLSVPADRRAAMGRAGRAHVLEHCDVRREAEKLGALLEALGSRP